MAKSANAGAKNMEVSLGMSIHKKMQGMDIPVIRQVNGRAVLEALRSKGRMGRKEIAELTNLSVPTVWRLVNELMKEGILAEVPDARSSYTKGRKTALVDINSSGGWVVAIDVGSTHIKGAVVDLSGNLHESHERDINARGDEAVTAAIFSMIRKIIDELSANWGKPYAIGISIPGTVDSQLGIVKLSFNLQLENYQVARILMEKLGIPVFVHNNVSASAIAEARIGHGRENPNFAYVSVGYGIGAAYVFNREIYVNPSRGEFGLMVVAPEGDPNRFGGRGYLESLASGRGIASAARRAIESGARTIMARMTPDGVDSITAKIVAEAANKGDEVAIDIMRKAANYLGIGIVNVANTMGLRVFVIDGGVSKSGDVFWNPLREAVEKYEYWPGEIQLETCSINSNAALVGAGLLALDKVFESII